MALGPRDAQGVKKRGGHISLSESDVSGVKGVKVDDVIMVTLKVKVKSVRREDFSEEKALDLSGEIMSGNIAQGKMMDRIKKADTMTDLDKAIGRSQAVETNANPNSHDDGFGR